MIGEKVKAQRGRIISSEERFKGLADTVISVPFLGFLNIFRILEKF